MLEIILFYNFFNLKFKEANVIRLIKVLNVSDKHDYKTFHKSYNMVNKDYCIDQSIGKPLRSKIVREHVAMKGTHTQAKKGTKGSHARDHSTPHPGYCMVLLFEILSCIFSFDFLSNLVGFLLLLLPSFEFSTSKKDKYLVWSHGANIHQRCGLNSSLLNNIVFHSSPVMTARHNHHHARPV